MGRVVSLILLCLVLTAACSQDSRPLLLVQVQGLRADVASIVARGTVGASAFKDQRPFTSGLSRIGLRLPAGGGGPVALTLDAFSGDCVVARGEGAIDVPGPGTYALEVSLASLASPDCGAAPDLATPDLRPAVPAGMVLVPGGTYRMGYKPDQDVTVATYFLDETEVTVTAYVACMNAGACTSPDVYFPNTRPRCTYGRAGKENHPINCLDWTQAGAYCAWRGKRLPSEEEWEYAARGTRASAWPWGNDTPDAQLCWKRFAAGDCAPDQCTCAVSTYPKTLLGQTDPAGVSDLAGNIAEWTSTPFATGIYVIRGGYWGRELAAEMRADARGAQPMTVRDGGYGLRCAQSAP